MVRTKKMRGKYADQQRPMKSLMEPVEYFGRFVNRDGQFKAENQAEDEDEDAKSARSRLSSISCKTDSMIPSNSLPIINNQHFNIVNDMSCPYPQTSGRDEKSRMVLVPLEATYTENAGRLGGPVLSYHSVIHVGAPLQKFKVQFELALDNNFLPHYSWRPWHSSLHYRNGYRASKSQTSFKGSNYYTMFYDNCEFLGKLHEDNVKFKSLVRLRRDNGEFKYNKSSIGARINFLAVDVVSRNHLARLPIDGMIGLSPKPESDSTGCKNLLIKLKGESLIDQLYVSMWFDSKFLRGQLLFGGHDSSRYKGRIYWHKSSADQWTLNLIGLSVGTSIIDQSMPCVARLSSVINQIQAPISAMERIYSHFRTSHDLKTGLVWVHSDNYAQLPDIHLRTERVEITLEPTVYLGELNRGYYLEIVPGSSDREWVLGTKFLENVYSIFDFSKCEIGLARKGTTPIENFKSLITNQNNFSSSSPTQTPLVIDEKPLIADNVIYKKER